MKIDESFPQVIEELSKVEEREIGGIRYFTKHLTDVGRKRPEPMDVNTLQAVVDYITDNTELPKSGLIVHVIDHENVSVKSSLNELHRNRDFFLRASTIVEQHKFGKWYSIEEFIISLQARFVMAEAIENIMRVVGNLTVESSLQSEDDGVTQRVAARTGIARMENVDLPNPITLRPYRTFIEVDQPESEFVFRMKGSVEEGFKCSLHEADGGFWKLDAIQSIKVFLAEALFDSVKVIA
ncbi:hypothetical protein KAR91_12135 [Candidatus Pacearchaeota archaeon]|nr:hypothetical protein [Candidatus Pacearchaeota archaeon]